MLKASSLLYAIYVCLIVALLTGSLLLIFNYQFRLKQQYFLEEALILVSENDGLQILDEFGKNLLDTQGTLVSGQDNFSTSYHISKWGFYHLLKTKTAFKKDTAYKVQMIGGRPSKDRIALYLTDLDQPLHIGGRTKITGNVKISKQGVKPAYINNQNYVGKQLIYGSIGYASRQLPLLQTLDRISLLEKNEERYLGQIIDRPIYNSFFEPTIVVNVNGNHNLSNINLSGNIVIQSNDSVHFDTSAILKDIVVEAPVVSFQQGFEGTVQVFASKRVYLNKGVRLKYPSSVYIKYESDVEEIEIFMDEDSKLAGGIVLNGDSYQSNLSRLVTLEKNALVIGDIYCRGKVQLRGKVIGTVYTNEFYLKTDASIYNNYIVNGEINNMELPQNFIGLPLFTEENIRYETIKEL